MERSIAILEDSSQSLFGGGQRITLEVINRTNMISTINLIDTINATWHSSIIKNITISNLFNDINNYNSFAFNLRLIKLSYSKLVKLKPSTIYVTTRKQFIPALIYRILHRSTNIIYHEHLIANNSLVNIIFDSIVNIFSKKIIFTSKYTYDNFKSKRKFLRLHKTEVSPLPPPKFDLPMKPSKHIPCSPFRIGYIGRIAEEKGALLFIDAISQLSDEINWSAVVAGSGKDESRLISKINQYNLKGKVEYVGQVDTNLQFYNSISLLIIPSFWVDETLCLTAIEAIQSCTPVLIANKGNLKNFIGREMAFEMNSPDPGEIAGLIKQAFNQMKSRNFRRNLVAVHKYHSSDNKFQIFFNDILSN